MVIPAVPLQKSGNTRISVVERQRKRPGEERKRGERKERKYGSEKEIKIKREKEREK